MLDTSTRSGFRRGCGRASWRPPSDLVDQVHVSGALSGACTGKAPRWQTHQVDHLGRSARPQFRLKTPGGKFQRGKNLVERRFPFGVEDGLPPRRPTAVKRSRAFGRGQPLSGSRKVWLAPFDSYRLTSRHGAGRRSARRSSACRSCGGRRPRGRRRRLAPGRSPGN